MPEGGAGAAGQNFLRAAEQGKIGHDDTASAAAAAMNAVKPALRSHEAATVSLGGDNDSSYWRDHGEDYQNRFEYGAGASLDMPSRGGKEPMKIPIGTGSEAQMAGALPTSFPEAKLASAMPSWPGAEAGGQQDQPSWMEMQAMQLQQQQAAMFAVQMQQSAMYGSPYPPPMSPMGYMPWWPPMDPSLMMGKGMPPYGPSMYGVPQASSGVSGGTAKGGKKGGGEKKTKATEQKKKGKAKAAAHDAPEPEDTEEAAANRSALLNEVRKNLQKCKYSWEEVMPHLLEFTRDQHGSRFLQTKLDESNDAERTAVLEGILPEVPTLAADAFGNFVVQKLFDLCPVEQKKMIADRLEGKVMPLSNEMHGCRVIQKALQVLPRESQQKLAKEFEGHVGTCIENMHGNHVIQKCIEQMPPDSVTFIINEVNQKVEFWATHGYGCRVIQRLLEHCTSSQLPRMLDQLIAPVAKFAKDSYGNYVVQHMLEHGRREDKAKIIHVLCRDIVEYSKNKCSSNVVEKCFEIASIGEHANQLEKDRQALYLAVLGPNVADPNSPLLMMMDDRFGNYIVQRMIEYSKGEDRLMLQQKLLAVEPILKNSNSGKHILNALHKEFGA